MTLLDCKKPELTPMFRLVQKRGVPWILTTSSAFEFGVIVPHDHGPRKKSDKPWESHSLRVMLDDPNKDIASSGQGLATLEGILTALVLWVGVHLLDS